MDRKGVLKTAAGVFAAAAILLLLLSPLADIHHFHINGWGGVLQDQTEYLSIARNLADHHGLTSNLIYTSMLSQPTTKNYPYMPGYFCLLGLSFALCGVGPLQAILPNLISFCIASCCIFLITDRLYGRRAAFFGAATFMLFPANIAYSFTAMEEMSFIAVTTLSFCIFVHLPDRLRPYLGPLLVAAAFCFRETGALLLLPMTGLILGGVPFAQRIERKRAVEAASFVILSLALLIGILLSPISSGRPPIIKAAVFAPAVTTVQDAFAMEHSSFGIGAWVGAMARNAVENIKEAAAAFNVPLVLLIIGVVSLTVPGHRKRRLTIVGALVLVTILFACLHKPPVSAFQSSGGTSALSSTFRALVANHLTFVANLAGNIRQGCTMTPWNQPPNMESVCLPLLIFAAPVTLVFGWRRRDILAAFSGVMGVIFLLMAFTLHPISFQNGVRNMLFTYPFYAVVLGGWLASQRTLNPDRFWIILGVIGAFAFLIAIKSVRQLPLSDKDDTAEVAFFDSLGIDQSRMLTTPYWLGLDYVTQHYPMKWAYLPRNIRTLRLLMSKFDVGTLVATRDKEDTLLTWPQIESVGFKMDREVKWRTHELFVFKRIN